MSYLSKRRGTQMKDEVEDDPLCSVCSTLDLRAILRNGIREVHAVSLGHLTDILNKHDQCGLCRLIFIGNHSFRQPVIDLSGFTCTLCTHGRLSYLNKGAMHLYLCIETSAKAVIPLQLEIRLLEESVSTIGGPREFYGRRVGQDVDVGLIKRWVRTCEKKHREACEKDWWRGPGEVLPNAVRVMDVIRMAIVPAPSSCRYVTLSYVWGGTGEGYKTTQANIKQRGIPGGLDASMMPGTISDTIQLVRQLGERYLWIDALCIVQDDLGDQAVQIGAMELIYGNSAFTIFAVGCSSARDPLPGVRPGTRDPKQQIAKIQGLHLALPLPFAHKLITPSEWNERGWTYQEAMLSRRRIFFTPHQVYFECRNGLCSEEMATDPGVAYHGVAISQVIPTSALEVHRERDSYVRLYIGIVNKYTQRKLTVESDIVDAVEALLKGLTKAFELAGGNYDKAFRFGMLLTGGLQVALLWQPVVNAPNSRRVPTNEMRTTWPSWSWAAWRGAVRYYGSHIFGSHVSVNFYAGRSTDDVRIDESLVEFYVVDDDGHPNHQYVEHHSRLIKPIAYVAPKGDIDLQQLIAENAPLLPGTLVFRTTYSRFDVTKPDDVRNANTVTNYDIYSILSDIPQPLTLVGRIILPSSTPSPTSYEFVVLSRASPCDGLYDEERFGKQYAGCMLYAMAVQKMRNDKRFERVGVGIIFEQAWMQSKPGEKIVYLG
ncbi:HET-domain-containing protein [Rhizopogon salebrosus TDB-379]|nr:HET-domain-containing protein [Rhizopogon salebrosus TDB-379]